MSLQRNGIELARAAAERGALSLCAASGKSVSIGRNCKSQAERLGHVPGMNAEQRARRHDG
jgi:hypothetical protein